jgi:hypothetical protein
MLKLSKFLLADKVAYQTVELHSSIDPYLDVLCFIILREVVESNDALISYLDINLVVVSLRTHCFD